MFTTEINLTIHSVIPIAITIFPFPQFPKIYFRDQGVILSNLNKLRLTLSSSKSALNIIVCIKYCGKGIGEEKYHNMLKGKSILIVVRRTARVPV